jgi:inhibitor of cysteine peptidase
MKYMLLLCLAFGSFLTTMAAEAKPITVTVGQPFQFSLQSNPTTGYHWQFAKPWDAKLLNLSSTRYKKPSSELPGAGGEQVWSFKALAEGKTTLALVYVRSWETNVPPAQSTNIEVVIKSAKAKAKSQDPERP